LLSENGNDNQTNVLKLQDIPAPGTNVSYIGDYELLEVIAQGGMGVVYKARQKSLNRIVALKLLLGGEHASADFRKRFRQEAELAAQLHHPNIVPIYEAGEHNGQPYFSMEYVPGHDLAGLTRGKPLPPEQAAEYLKTIAEAVHYAHLQGVLHRDLKPSNVLLGSDGRLRITDFGLAKRFADSSTLTLSGATLGTPGYLPPEQVSTRRGTVGITSDVYSLGAILYYLLTGLAPFQGEAPADVLVQVLNDLPVPPSEINPLVPKYLNDLSLKCLAKKSADRFPSANDVANALESEPMDDYLNPHQDHSIRPSQILKWLALGGLAVALVAIGIWILTSKTEPGTTKSAGTRISPVPAATSDLPILEFEETTQIYAELEQGYSLPIRWTGPTNKTISFRIRSIHDSSPGGNTYDYEHIDQRMAIPAGENRVFFGRGIVDDLEPNADREIRLELSEPSEGIRLGQKSATITILDNDLKARPGVGIGGGVKSTVVDHDGSIIVAGGFWYVSGANRTGIARVAPDGKTVLSFNPAQGPSDWLTCVALCPDGKLIITGNFIGYNDVRCGRVARLDSNGALDLDFKIPIGAETWVQCAAVQPDGKVIVGGSFKTMNGVGCNCIARLNPDGGLDPLFLHGTGANGNVVNLKLQPDGKILVGGDFTQFSGVDCSGLVRLNPDGSIDPSFKLGVGPSGVTAMHVLQDGRILVTGWFHKYLSRPRQGLMRLHENGRVDESFIPKLDTNCVPDSIAVAADGKIVVGGLMRVLPGCYVGFVARFDASGHLDASFHRSFAEGGVVQSVQILSNNCIFVAGEFKYLGGVYAPAFVVLDADGRVPARPTEWAEWPKSQGGNGHCYALTTRALTWLEAEAEAQKLGGHLASITSSNVQSFVERTFLKGELMLRPLWIGLRETGTSYGWAGGEKLTYSNWHPNEPSRHRGENYICLNWHFSADHLNKRGDWNAVTSEPTDHQRWRASGPYYGIIERSAQP
jgi:uncharacterized delta-60 repeat protein